MACSTWSSASEVRSAQRAKEKWSFEVWKVRRNRSRAAELESMVPRGVATSSSYRAAMAPLNRAAETEEDSEGALHVRMRVYPGILVLTCTVL